MEKSREESIQETLSRRTLIKGILGAAAMIKTAGMYKVVESMGSTAEDQQYSGSKDIGFRAAPEKAETSNQSEEAPDLGIQWLPPAVTQWQDKIRRSGKRHEVDPQLIAIIMTLESTGRPEVVSSAAAEGLMQIWPPTAAEIAEKLNIRDYDLKDPETSLEFGAFYLRGLLDEFQPETEAELSEATVGLVAAGYNGGPGRAHNLAEGKDIPYETENYAYFASGFWRERHQSTSKSFRQWEDGERSSA